jgi:histidinol-phosphate/aromatic aminotransferase/cobyric acid decarboxylase-like protein
MAVPHYAYLALKIPGPKGVITVQGSFEVSNTPNKEFNRMVQTFSMTAKYARLKGETNHNVLPDVGRSLPDQAFDATQDSKKVWVHPTNPNNTTSIAVNLDPA